MHRQIDSFTVRTTTGSQSFLPGVPKRWSQKTCEANIFQLTNGKHDKQWPTWSCCINDLLHLEKLLELHYVGIMATSQSYTNLPSFQLKGRSAIERGDSKNCPPKHLTWNIATTCLNITTVVVDLLLIIYLNKGWQNKKKRHFKALKRSRITQDLHASLGGCS